MEKLFERIIDNDEKIIKIFKPNKTKLFISGILKVIFSLFLFVLMGVLAILFPEEGMPVEHIYLVIPIGIFVLAILLSIILISIYYKNVYYAYTNKRLIIRSGIFGIDFKSLDMGMIGAVDVYVSLIDKLLRKDTGTISFGSMASPMMTQQNGGSGYRFSHVLAPYETYKEIKSAIEQFKQNK